MDNNANARTWEIVKTITVLVIVAYYNDWFLLNPLWGGFKFLIAGYAVFSLAITIYICRNQFFNKSILHEPAL